MDVSIKEEWLSKNDLTLSEVLVGLLCKLKSAGTIERLIQQGRLIRNADAVYITQGFNDMVDSVLLSSNDRIPSYNKCMTFAIELRKVVPKGRKKGTPYYYVCNNAEVTLALQRFFYYYGDDLEDFKGNEPDEFDNIFNHIYNIVKGFYSRFTDNNAAYFPLLKYFIIKVEDDDISSPLMSEFEIIRLEMIRDGTNRAATKNY